MRGLFINNYGTLYDEPIRLLRNERRDTATFFSLLTTGGNDMNRNSEIAGKIKQLITNLSRSISVLTDLGYVKKSIRQRPPQTVKRAYIGLAITLSHPINYKSIHPKKYLIEFNRQYLIMVMDIIRKDFSTYVGQIWEKIAVTLLQVIKSTE